MRRSTIFNVLLLVCVNWSALSAQDGDFDWQQGRELHAGIRYTRSETEQPRKMVVHGVQIDARTPGLRLHTTARRDEWAVGKTETNRQTTRDFLRQSRSSGVPTVFAINADAFSPWPAPYDQPTPADLAGLAVSEGTVVSQGSGSPSLIQRKAGELSIEVTNPDIDSSDITLAISGFALCLDNGQPVASGEGLHPRTGLGLSQDGRYLVVVAIDGRQPASLGATTQELGQWLRHFGAHRGINMDGGGSTTLAWWDAESADADKCKLLNRPVGNGVKAENLPAELFAPTERANGNNLGVAVEVQEFHTWARTALLGDGIRLAATPPFAFQYGAQHSRELLAGWKRTVERRTPRDGRQECVVTYTDPATNLEVVSEVTLYDELPAAEWLIVLRNAGHQDTPILEKIRPLDLLLDVAQPDEIVVHYANGSTCSPTDYQPFDHPLKPESEIVLQPVGGRSSNGRLPFFNLDWGTGGLVAAIGWSGQWQCRLARDAGNQLTVEAGQQTTHFVLRPGESVRTPRILLVGWSGDRFRGHNDLRRIIYRYHTPLLAGEKPLPPTQCNTWFPVGDDGGKASEQNQIELLEAYQGLGIEYLVMDAGWYGVTPNWAENTGTWTPRTDTFPHGLKPVGEAAQRCGIRFGMWFEPERIVRGTQLDQEHPEWLLKVDESGNRLLNLGLPETQQWFIDLVSHYVEEVPLGYFRHDFNIDPLPFWLQADAPDRQGITEIRYIEGLYRVWDTLRAKYPHLMMEGCASGGRRIDLESIGRFHTYWKTDLYGNLLANQSHAWGMNLYLPAHLFNTPLFDLSDNPLYPPSPTTDAAVFDMRTSPYAFHSLIGGAFCAGWDPRAVGFDRELAAARIREFKALRHLTVGDFYPLLPYTLEADQWIGYQFHREDLDEGLVLAFRREKSEYAAVDVVLRGLQPPQHYELTSADGSPQRHATGAELMHRLPVTIDHCPGSVLIRYRAVASESP